MERRSLSDILRNGKGGGNWFDGDWSNIPVAPEFGPIPPGKYEAHLVGKEPFNAGTGTPGIKLEFNIVSEGTYKGRRLWYDIWLTETAKENARRDFLKLGITNKGQIEAPLPLDRRIRCSLKVVLRKSDQGNDYNEVRSFEVVGVDPVEVDPFAPTQGGQP